MPPLLPPSPIRCAAGLALVCLLGLGCQSEEERRAASDERICKNNLRMLNTAAKVWAEKYGEGRYPDSLQPLQVAFEGQSFTCPSDDGVSYRLSQTGLSTSSEDTVSVECRHHQLGITVGGFIQEPR